LYPADENIKAKLLEQNVFPSEPTEEVTVITFEDFSDAKKIITSTKIFSLAESLGGVESLCGHPATMTHAAIPRKEREKSGVVDGLIRLSVGIEGIEDLIKDLNQALEKI